MNPGEKSLDVRDLAHPEPLEKILAALDELEPGETLRVVHRREPQLLFPILKSRGFEFTMQSDEAAGRVELRIFRTGESEIGTDLVNRDKGSS